MKDQNVEINEALDACENALECLEEAKRHLNSARNWGIFDIVGGGLVATLVKRQKMSNAREYMKKTRSALRVLKDELKDVDDILNIDLKTDDFLSFSDYFFDNIFSDLIVQDKINDARDNVDYLINNITLIRQSLLERMI